MIKNVSKKELVRSLLITSIIYFILQVSLFIIDDKKLSRYFWIEHKNVQELVEAGKPEKSQYTALIKFISDNHFWILRAGIVITIILALYYKDKNEKLHNLFKNISISVILTLLIASGIITWLLKISIGKPRPGTKLDVYSAFTLSEKYFSFPSGHTTETFSYIIPYIYFLKKYYIFILLLIYGFLAAITRVMLSYHYFTDILFGIYITAIAGGIICYSVEHRKIRKQCKNSKLDNS